MLERLKDRVDDLQCACDNVEPVYDELQAARYGAQRTASAKLAEMSFAILDMIEKLEGFGFDLSPMQNNFDVIAEPRQRKTARERY